MHRLLERQLKKFTGRTDGFGEEIQRLLKAVNDAYTASDDDRALIERSMENHYDVLHLHSFYVRYKLPLTVEVQHFEYAAR